MRPGIDEWASNEVKVKATPCRKIGESINCLFSLLLSLLPWSFYWRLRCCISWLHDHFMVWLGGRFFTVDTKENSQRLLENSRAKRERSRLNMASRLHLAMGEAGAGPKERKNVRKTERKNRENDRVTSRMSSCDKGSPWTGRSLG